MSEERENQTQSGHIASSPVKVIQDILKFTIPCTPQGTLTCGSLLRFSISQIGKYLMNILNEKRDNLKCLHTDSNGNAQVLPLLTAPSVINAAQLAVTGSRSVKDFRAAPAGGSFILPQRGNPSDDISLRSRAASLGS